jgi:glycosyltransferase involved in cell wall biosynthesis
MKDIDAPVVRIVELYEIYLTNNSLINYLTRRNFSVGQFAFFKTKPKRKFLNKSKLIIQEIKCSLILFRHISHFRNEIIFCRAGQFSFFLLTKVFENLLGRNYHLYVYNFYLHSLGNKRYIKTILKFLLKSNRITLIVQSPQEVNYYSQFSKNKVHFVPYCSDYNYLPKYENVPNTDYIFSGGYTNRDYSLLIECAKQNSDLLFVIVKSSLNQNIAEQPQNVIIFNDIDFDVFNGLMERSNFVIVPLKENVGSCGQMLCLGAMKMCKPVVYCNISAINYYFIPNITGIPYEIGNSTSLNTAIRLMYLSKFNRTTMANKALERYEQLFTLEHRNKELENILLKNS